MKIPKFLDDLSVISKLGDNPGADNGLTAEGLKAKFDEAGLKLQTFLNETLIEKINSLFSLDAPPHEGMNMTGPINMNKNKLGGLADPAEDGDAVNLKFANENYRAADWMPTIAEIGAAPSGYVDERGQYTDYTSALAQIKSVYASMGDRTKRCLFIDILNLDSTNFPTGSYFVEIYREWENYGTIVFTSSTYIKIVIRIAGSWGDFCYENPPMVVGVEYRTTERWNGKPVWTSLTKISGLPNVAYGQYNLAATNCDNVIRKHTSYERADGATFLNILEAGDIYVSSYGNPYIVFNRTTSDLSNMTAYVTLFYTKTTD